MEGGNIEVANALLNGCKVRLLGGGVHREYPSALTRHYSLHFRIHHHREREDLQH